MSTTDTTNYALKKVDEGTEIDTWAPFINGNWDKVSNQMKVNADAAAAANTLATGKAPLVHQHDASTVFSGGTVPAARLPAFTGDVTSAVGTAVNVIAANAVTTAKILDANVTNAKLAAMVANTMKGTIAGGVPIDLTAAQVLTLSGATTAAAVTTQVTDATTKEVQNAQSGNYTLVVGDAGKMVTFSGVATVTVNSSVFSAGHRVDLLQLGTGVVTIAGSATKRVFPVGASKLAGQYAGATIWFISASEYVLIGNVIV